MDNQKLSARVEALEGRPDNMLDVAIEVALFEPRCHWIGAHPNNAFTKVIYTNTDGDEDVCWADAWTEKPIETIAALKARGL